MLNPLKLFKRSASITSTDQLLNLLSTTHETASGSVVSTDTAQNLPAVYCAVNTISEAIASMPVHVYKKNESGDKERQRSNVLERLLNISPNGYQTAFDFKVALMRSALLTGNAYAEIIYDNAGRVQRIIPLHPNEVTVKELPNYRLGYHVTRKGKYRSLQQEEVLHIRVNSDDGIIGKSPITVCRESLGAEMATQEHGSSLFKNKCAPSGVFTWPNKMSADTMRTALDYITKNYTGNKNSGKPLIMTEGGQFTNLTMSNHDAEWLESKKFGIAEIARMFKISPIFLQDYSNSTYSNFAEASKAFLQQTLKPWLTNIEASLLMNLIPDRAQSTTSIQFETKDIMRTTARERFELYDIAIRNGLMNPNQCRRAENMEPREGGDQYSQSWLQQAKAAEPTQD